MTLSYDSEADVLYVSFEQADEPCLYVENAQGDVLRVTKRTQQVVGCTILHFSARQKEGTITVPEIGTVTGPKDISRAATARFNP